jgi:hypothetical protein
MYYERRKMQSFKSDVISVSKQTHITFRYSNDTGCEWAKLIRNCFYLYLLPLLPLLLTFCSRSWCFPPPKDYPMTFRSRPVVTNFFFNKLFQRRHFISTLAKCLRFAGVKFFYCFDIDNLIAITSKILKAFLINPCYPFIRFVHFCSFIKKRSSKEHYNSSI